MISHQCFSLLLGELPPILSPMSKYLEKGIKHKIFKGEIIQFTKSQWKNCHFIYIEKGMLKLCSQRSDGSEIDFSFFGASTGITEQNQSDYLSLCDKLSIVACENTVIYCFSKQSFFDILKADNEFFDAFFEFQSSNLSMLMQRTSLTACLDADKRISGWLLRLCKGVFPTKDNCFFIPCTMTQQKISDYLFIHITTFNTVLPDLNRALIY